MKRNVDAEVISSTFDEPPERHVSVATWSYKKLKGWLNMGAMLLFIRQHNKTCVHIMLLFLTVENFIGRSDFNALKKPKQFFAARNTEEGGSLTIVSTALIDTGSRADELSLKSSRVLVWNLFSIGDLVTGESIQHSI